MQIAAAKGHILGSDGYVIMWGMLGLVALSFPLSTRSALSPQLAVLGNR